MASRTRAPVVVRLSEREKDELDATVATRIMGWHVTRQGADWALLNPAGQVAHRLPAAGPDRSGDTVDEPDDSDGAPAGVGDGGGSSHVLPAVRVRLAPRATRPPAVYPTAFDLPARPPDFTGHYSRYSREMSWAMTMVEAVTDAHRDRDRESPDDVLFRLEWVPGRWRATFLRPRQVSVEAETDAVAICLAALEVMGVR